MRTRPFVLVAILMITSFATVLIAGRTQSTLPTGPLVFGVFSARFGGDGAFGIEGEGWPTFKGSWKIDGDRIELLSPGGPGGCDGPGLYQIRIANQHVSFELLNDACRPRVMILDRSEWRPATEPEAVAPR